MPSVAPHVTVSSVSGSTASPVWRFTFALMASRRSRAPHVIAYWFTSAAIAAVAACFTISGAAKSGKPCARLTAPCAWASRVISRITDSVKQAALRDARARRTIGSLAIPLTPYEQCRPDDQAHQENPGQYRRIYRRRGEDYGGGFAAVGWARLVEDASHHIHGIAHRRHV